MPRSKEQPDHRSPAREGVVALPAGTPAWITPDLVLKTLRIWQPFYQEPLTLDDAVIILSGVGRLFRILSRDDSS